MTDIADLSELKNPELRKLNPDVFGLSKPLSELSEKPVKRSKYGNKRTMYNGVMYASQGEAHRAQELDFEVQAGTVLWWARQPRFVLEGGIEYMADFIVQRTGGIVEVEDFKGFDTNISKLKRKQIKARYGIDVKIIK